MLKEMLVMPLSFLISTKCIKICLLNHSNQMIPTGRSEQPTEDAPFTANRVIFSLFVFHINIFFMFCKFNFCYSCSAINSLQTG